MSKKLWIQGDYKRMWGYWGEWKVIVFPYSPGFALVLVGDLGGGGVKMVVKGIFTGV